jgi:hypothetical protein
MFFFGSMGYKKWSTERQLWIHSGSSAFWGQMWARPGSRRICPACCSWFEAGISYTYCCISCGFPVSPLRRVYGCRGGVPKRWSACSALRRATLLWWFLVFSLSMGVARSGRRGILGSMVFLLAVKVPKACLGGLVICRHWEYHGTSMWCGCDFGWKKILASAPAETTLEAVAELCWNKSVPWPAVWHEKNVRHSAR